MAARANTELEVLLLYRMCFIFLFLSASFSFYPAEKPRMNNILTSQTEPYDLSFSRSFQNLTHLPPSYEMAMKAELSKYFFPSSLSTAHPVCVCEREIHTFHIIRRWWICHISYCGFHLLISETNIKV